MSNRSIFLTIYFAGLLLTFLCGILLINQVHFISSQFLLGLGITHVLALFIFTLFSSNQSTSKIEQGNFIQTAGYLHTLIGFLVAIGLFGNTIDVNNLLPPLSSALITSLLGWSLGGFFVAQGEHDQPSLNDEIAKAIATEVAKVLDRELIKYTKDISKSFDELDKTSLSLKDRLESLDKIIDQKNEDLYTSLGNVVATIYKKNEDLSNGFTELRTVLDDQKEPLVNSFQKINDALSEQAELFKQSTYYWSESVEEIRQSLNSLTRSLNDLSSGSKYAEAQMYEVVTAIEKASQEIRKISQEAEKVRHYLENTRTLWEQLRELTRYIQEVTQ